MGDRDRDLIHPWLDLLPDGSFRSRKKPDYAIVVRGPLARHLLLPLSSSDSSLLSSSTEKLSQLPSEYDML